jgi:hypothetical protein
MARLIKFLLGVLILAAVALVIRVALGTRPYELRTATPSTLVNLEGLPAPERDMSRLRVVVARASWARGAGPSGQWPPIDAQLDLVGSILAQIGRYNADIIVLADAPFSGPRGMAEDFARELAIESRVSHTVSTSTWSRAFVPFPYVPLGAWTGAINGGHAIITRYPTADATAVRGAPQPIFATPAPWGVTPATTALRVQTGPARWLNLVVRDAALTTTAPPDLAGPDAHSETMVVHIGVQPQSTTIANDNGTIGVELPPTMQALRSVTGATFDGVLVDPVLFIEIEVATPTPEGSGANNVGTPQ